MLRSRWFIGIVLFVAAANVAALGWFLAGSKLPKGTEIVFPQGWVAVYLSGGGTLYGRIGALTPDIMRLEDAYALEAYAQAEAEGAATSSTSESFSLKNDDPQLRQRFFLVKQEDPLYVNRQSILYWEAVSSSSEAGKLLSAS